MNDLFLKYCITITMCVFCCSLFIVNCSLHAQNKLDVIYIDAGHGGKDPGGDGPAFVDLLSAERVFHVEVTHVDGPDSQVGDRMVAVHKNLL